MPIEQPMLHDRIEELLLQKARQRWNEIGNLRWWGTRQIEKILIRETTAYEKIDEALNASDWRIIKVGDEWAGGGEFAWFRFQFTVPREFAGKTLVALFRFGKTGWLGGEGCLFIDGIPYQGIDPNHPDVILTEKAKPGEKFDIVVACVSTPVWQGIKHKMVLEQADIAVLNTDVKDYYYDLGFILGIAESLPKGDRRRARIVRIANKSVDSFNPDANSFDALAESARNAARILMPLYKAPANASSLEFACNGHSHIDVAWLWPYAETIRKCSRTFSTVDRLMEEYPYYLFTQSQAQLYEFTKEHYPQLYQKIKKRINERRFEPQGSMWVEADCNLTSGESLVRQILLGKSYFLDEFGIETDVFWLPDVFGYSAALPQILKLGGIKYFSTIKISWSQFNKFPYSTFWWEGIDGTRVLAHFPPSNDYNARIDPGTLRGAAENYREKDRSDIALYPYGFGDGGGGPTREHLEHLKRAANLEGVPKCKPSWVSDFFHELEKRSEDLPTWVGELYLEYHRGTYTTQSRNKRANRKSELLLRDAEMACGLAWLLAKAEYPHERFTRAWKLICKNQFHDVIPGTSVTDVYKDTAIDYQEIAEIGEKMRAQGLRVIGASEADGNQIIVFNSLAWNRSDAVCLKVPGNAKNWHVETIDGQVLPSQPKAGNASELWFEPQALPGIGLCSFKLVKGVPRIAKANIKVSTSCMENSFYRVKIDRQGLITSIYDKRAKREVLPRGARANLFQLFEDKPLSWDAWDIEFYYRDKGNDITDLTEITVEEAGPVRGSVRMVRRFGNSQIEQRIVLWGSNPRIDFETHVDWHEATKMLKVAFPVNVHGNKARYEIQFGSVERPNHWNTGWDFARFEVPAQKWVDLSQADYGVSLLNDCKYGHDIYSNVIRLTLLRSPKMPDSQADMGEHVFTYSLLPHQGDWIAGETVRRAYELNVPMTAWLSEDKPRFSGSLLSVDSPNVIVETIKKAEREDALIMRLYECSGGLAEVTLTAGSSISRAAECDLLERDKKELEVDNNKIQLSFTPFEIKTVKLVAG
ncbi:MAG: alpha-mannosidase [Armatimonadetes bacterium]|nr:alpha-mannosidase [Armatimonadota bacterium]